MFLRRSAFNSRLVWQCGVVLLGVMVSACATAPRLEPVREPVATPVATPAVVPADEPLVTAAVPSAAPPSAPLVPTPIPAPANAAVQTLSLEDFVERNDDNMLRIYVGMSRSTVDRIMNNYRAGAVTNPYKRQLISGTGGKVHEVLFYLTRKPRAGQRITENALTPVVLEDEHVTAIGRYPVKKLRRAACRARGETTCP